MKRKLKKYIKSLNEYDNLSNDQINDIINNSIMAFKSSKVLIREQVKNSEITKEEAKIRISNLGKTITG